jgi:hypothetical protein
VRRRRHEGGSLAHRDRALVSWRHRSTVLIFGVKFDPQVWSWPPGMKLTPKGEDHLFAPPFF